jgi:hypothetical protein
MAKIVPLEEIVNKVKIRTRLATPSEIAEVFDPLDEELSQHELNQDVVGIFVYDGHGQINCYLLRGHYIDSGIIFRRLNQSIGVKGTKVTGTTTYREIHRLSAKMKGFFVPSLDFLGYQEEENFDNDKNDGEEDRLKDNFTDTYLALINLPVNPDERVYSFNLE